MKDKVRVICSNVWLPLYEDSDPLTDYFNRVHSVVLFDRFNYLNQFTGYNVVNFNYTFPESNSTRTISDLMLDRARSIYDLALSTNRQIYVMFSGGVDSTALVLALLNVIDDISKLHIICAKTSRLEYSKLYDYLESLGLLTIVSGGELLPTWSKVAQTDYVVTGFPADQLFGSIINQTLEVPHTASWKEFLNNSNNDMYEEAFKHYGIPIKTISEFTWFMNFACKWELVCNELLTNSLPKGNTINFYETDEFAKWSVSSFDILHKYDQKDPKYYKIQLKEFINSQFNDLDYLINKGKTGSLNYAKSEDIDNNSMLLPIANVILESGYVSLPYSHIVSKTQYSSIYNNLNKVLLLPCRRI